MKKNIQDLMVKFGESEKKVNELMEKLYNNEKSNKNLMTESKNKINELLLENKAIRIQLNEL